VKPLESLEEIFHVAFGYMASKALFAGLHLGVFDALASGPKQLPALVEATGAEERSLVTLLTALTAIGLLERRGDAWVDAPATAEFLVSGAPGDFGDYLRYQIDRQMVPFMHHLTDVLRGDRTTVPFRDYEAWFGDADEASLYSESQHAASVAPAMMLAAQADWSRCRRLLDVGGGSGAFAIALCQLHAGLSAVILDFPNVLAVARKRVAAAGLADRIALLAGNALETSWPDRQDAVLFSYISGSVAAEAVGELYRRAHGALAAGGRVLVHDFMVDDDRTGPPLAAIWALQHATFTPAAASLTPAFIAGLLAEAGFEDVSFTPFIPGMTRLASARKPA